MVSFQNIHVIDVDTIILTDFVISAEVSLKSKTGYMSLRFFAIQRDITHKNR